MLTNKILSNKVTRSLLLGYGQRSTASSVTSCLNYSTGNASFQPNYSNKTAATPSSFNNNNNNSSTSNANKQQQSLLNDERFYSEEKFIGIAKEPFAKEINNILMGELDSQDIEIKPDGIIYLPEIKYRRILNQAFGPGGWALKPFGPPVVIDGSLIRPYALYCMGRYVSESLGEQPYVEGGHLSFATANEAAKSNALVRCCKDLGIGSSLWDPTFIREWKQNNAEEKFYVHVKTNDKKKLWTLKDGSNPMGYPWKEANSFDNQQQPQQSFSSRQPQQPQQQQQSQQQYSSSSSISQPITSEERQLVVEKPTQFNPNQASLNHQQSLQMDDTLPVGPSPSSQASSNNSSTNDYVNSEEIDIDSIVPPQLKKYAGKTWREVVQDPRGVQYIGWASREMKGRVQLQAQAIFDFIQQHQEQQQQQQQGQGQ
ncbi:mitochondrial genome maintenance protein [Cavenderia fasciculata]|uniref:Mitochondrial genome maintenance protein n=1 Tax=Cavenderia fasciculata TaxID=261658 RepID=F4PG75_CACFS|nr:mitochondrial genome maintenance protein [Cavenderia fasciculata]EGG24709.1 mitochondrial genome maintenance protein [Cavenderia fasciculata]|eukprot:XP_004362560.1 mitochondrial genome maintenance protein [Cavenderia fasciculata]